MVTSNPYATSRAESEFAGPVNPGAIVGDRYAAPDYLAEGSAYNNPYGYSYRLDQSANGIPDAERLGAAPIRDFHGTEGNEDKPLPWYRIRGRSAKERESVVDVESIGWTTTPGINYSDRRHADNPRRTPPPEQRITARMSPSNYSFMRPFDQTVAHSFNGMHFSMADHRRNYDTGGMAPAMSRRNTQRLDPAPWDTNIVDEAPIDELQSARLTAIDVISTSGRSYRLGG